MRRFTRPCPPPVRGRPAPRPRSNVSPTCRCTRSTTPSRHATISLCIFMLSMITSGWPVWTASPGATAIACTTPGIGAVAVSAWSVACSASSIGSTTSSRHGAPEARGRAPCRARRRARCARCDRPARPRSRGPAVAASPDARLPSIQTVARLLERARTTSLGSSLAELDLQAHLRAATRPSTRAGPEGRCGGSKRGLASAAAASRSRCSSSAGGGSASVVGVVVEERRVGVARRERRMAPGRARGRPRWSSCPAARSRRSAVLVRSIASSRVARAPDHLGDHRIERRADLPGPRACRGRRASRARPGSGRARSVPVAGTKPGGGVLGVDAALDRAAGERARRPGRSPAARRRRSGAARRRCRCRSPARSRDARPGAACSSRGSRSCGRRRRPSRRCRRTRSPTARASATARAPISARVSASTNGDGASSMTFW